MSSGIDSKDERHRQALALFDDLVECDAATRASRLEALRASDPALHQQVQALLDADAREGVLDRPPLTGLSADEEALPDRIGPWRITGVAGRGGMGAVYLGQRDDGQFQQQVAIKLIRTGMDTPELRARFLRERQILAALRHPNIATLLDGGVTEAGAPYFAMERVGGQPIDLWCDAHRATLEQRVRLLLQVCAAVQHAHQNLTVHRDLKPGNILVGPQGEVKLLDFGIAKLLDGEEGATRDQPHTPQYAAPEQLEGGAITTATDVYGLGVVLHRLLCGAVPAGSRDDPEPLSHAAQRVSADEARARGLPSKQALAKRLRGDLSAIVLHCLEPLPERRYPSVNALAGDLEAWLSGAPVTARAQTRGYLLRKFIRRNRKAVALAAVAMVATLAGIAGVLWQADKAQKAAAESQAQLDYLSSLLQVLAPSTAEARELNRSKLVAAAAEKARNELGDKPASLASVEYALAQVAMNVGDYPQAMRLADSAYARRLQLFGADSVESARALVLAAGARTEVSPPKVEDALQKLGAAVTVLRRRAPGSVALVDALQNQAAVLSDQDKPTEADEAIAEAATLCEGALSTDAVCEMVWVEQGGQWSHSRQPAKAIPFLKRAFEARRHRLGEDHASTLDLASMLASAQADAGDLQDGLPQAEKVYAAYQRIYTQPTESSLRATLRLSRLYKRAGEQARAVALVDEYIRAARKLFGDDHPNTALGLSDRASLLFGQGRFDEAAAQFTEAARAYGAHGGDVNAALVQGFAADSLREAGRAAEALPSQREAVETLRKRYPNGQHVMLARALVNLALTESAAGQQGRALAHFDEGLAMHRAVQSDVTTLANARALRGKALFDAGKKTQGEAELRAALEAMRGARERAPNQYWEPFALLTSVACRQHAADCEALRQESRRALELPLAATTQARLRAAVSPE